MQNTNFFTFKTSRWWHLSIENFRWLIKAYLKIKYTICWYFHHAQYVRTEPNIYLLNQIISFEEQNSAFKDNKPSIIEQIPGLVLNVNFKFKLSFLIV